MVGHGSHYHIHSPTKWAFGFSWNQCSRFYFHVSVLFFFFNAWTVNLLCKNKNYCSYTIVVLFTYCRNTVHELKILKMGSTVLFTHLKIILLQCFQFSVFSFSNNKLNPNGPIVFKLRRIVYVYIYIYTYI